MSVLKLKTGYVYYVYYVLLYDPGARGTSCVPGTHKMDDEEWLSPPDKKDMHGFHQHVQEG